MVVRVLGGGIGTVGHVLAWYPVLTAILTAILIYGTTTMVTEDRRIGLAAVGMLAVLPGHAFRTSLGFADHHPFDYLWLAVTMFGLVIIAYEAHQNSMPFSRLNIVGTLTISLGIAAQTLAWDNSPIILAAIAPYLALEALRALHDGDSPLHNLSPILSGLGLAAGFVWLAHTRFGWHTELVSSAPLLLLIGGVGLVIAGEIFFQMELPAIALAGGETVIGALILYGFKSLRPDQWSQLTTSLEARLLADRPIAEVQSIFSDSGGWLLLFGFIFLLALPYLLWATQLAIEDAPWLPPVTYAW